MKKVTVSDLRYRFSRVEAHLNKGEEVEVYRREKLIGRLVPVRPSVEDYPDFAALSRRIFGKKKTQTTGTDLVSEGRGRY